MAATPDAPHEELLWTIAAARLVLGGEMSIQAPPNLSGEACGDLVDAGIDDWGGVSPVTPDHVNPEAPWPAVEALRDTTETRGKVLVERLPSYPRYVRYAPRWHAPRIATAVIRASDSEGYARMDSWSPGLAEVTPATRARTLKPRVTQEVEAIVADARGGLALTEDAIVRLFAARDDEFDYVCEEADALRQETVGDVVRYVVNRHDGRAYHEIVRFERAVD